MSIKLNAVARVAFASKRTAKEVTSLTFTVCVWNRLTSDLVAKSLASLNHFHAIFGNNFRWVSRYKLRILIYTHWLCVCAVNRFQLRLVDVLRRHHLVAFGVCTVGNHDVVIAVSVLVSWLTVDTHFYFGLFVLRNFAKLFDVSNTNASQNLAHVASICFSIAITLTSPFVR